MPKVPAQLSHQRFDALSRRRLIFHTQRQRMKSSGRLADRSGHVEFAIEKYVRHRSVRKRSSRLWLNPHNDHAGIAFAAEPVGKVFANQWRGKAVGEKSQGHELTREQAIAPASVFPE